MKKLVLLCLIFFTTNVLAQKAAIVLSISNKVTALHQGTTSSLTRGASLEAGDAITTADKAKADIRYLNGTLVNITANSNYKILAYSPKANEVQIKAQLNIGAIYSKTTGKTKEHLKTPVAALAILGTKYAAYVKDKRHTYLSVTEGHVEVNGALFGPGSNILITPEGITNAQFPNQKDLENENKALDVEMESDSVEGDNITDIENSEDPLSIAEAEIPSEFSPADPGIEELVALADTTLVIPDIGGEDIQLDYNNELILE